MQHLFFKGFCYFLLWLPLQGLAQSDFYEAYEFTEADTLRGMLRPERTCYNVTYYELDIEVIPEQRSLRGYVDIHFTVLDAFERLQVDLYENMVIDRIVWRDRELPFERRYDAVFVDFPLQQAEDKGVFRVYYHGRPTTAANPPWDGGFVWKKDERGVPWIGVACEGDGASLWWPNKDHLSDEPDSMAIRVAVPKGLTCVANGHLRSRNDLGDRVQYDWFVSYPINNYNVTVNIADYVHFRDHYIALDGDSLALDYYVLRENEEKARRHFQQVPQVLACFEQYFGKYPFWEDGYALVETPYLGMEHQGAIAYGNQYKRGYLGGMIPRDMDWDYIIVHETGHEYFGNSVSCGDLAEMWIHESFTIYMEALYVECAYSYEDAIGYLRGQRPFIRNRQPILGPRDVNWEDWEGSDHYFKGAWVLHTLRHTVNDDTSWWELLRGFYDRQAISITTTEDVIEYVNQFTGSDYHPFFQQYLGYPDIPTFEYRLSETPDGLELECRWDADVPAFKMPLLVGRPGSYQRIEPTTEWQSFQLKKITKQEFEIPTDLFLIKTKKR